VLNITEYLLFLVGRLILLGFSCAKEYFRKEGLPEWQVEALLLCNKFDRYSHGESRSRLDVSWDGL